MSKVVCRDCVFFHRNASAVFPEGGECRVRAPSSNGEGRPIGTATMIHVPFGARVWPYILRSDLDWCGEWMGRGMRRFTDRGGRQDDQPQTPPPDPHPWG